MGRHLQIRQLIAQEAARLMYEEGIKEYRDAKRKAAKRYVEGTRPPVGACLPSNAEIHTEMRRLLELHEEQVLPERLFRLRLLALQIMENLARFEPLLVGSVLAGTATERSDIDLHLFADAPEEVEEQLRLAGIAYETELVTVRQGSEFHDYPHLYLDEDGVVIDCSIYPRSDRRRVPRSSITGRAMERATIARLKMLIGESLPG